MPIWYHQLFWYGQLRSILEIGPIQTGVLAARSSSAVELFTRPTAKDAESSLANDAGDPSTPELLLPCERWAPATTLLQSQCFLMISSSISSTGTPLVSGTQKMMNSVMRITNPAKKMNTPHVITQSIERNVWPIRKVNL